MNCSDPSDAFLYAFDPIKCVAQAGTACTLAERATLTRVATCDQQISLCLNPNDRATALMAINACATGTMLSNGCIQAIQ